MATPKKLTVYNIDPQNLEETKIAVFRLEDGKVQPKYFGNKKDKARHENLLDAVCSPSGLITVDDGAKFMEMLQLAWRHTSFMSVRED